MFDNLFGTIETGETDSGGVEMFSLADNDNALGVENGDGKGF